MRACSRCKTRNSRNCRHYGLSKPHLKQYCADVAAHLSRVASDVAAGLNRSEVYERVSVIYDEPMSPGSSHNTPTEDIIVQHHDSAAAITTQTTTR